MEKKAQSKDLANVQAALGNLLKSSASAGQRLNYNFQDSKYTFWPFWTIEQAGHEHRHKARAIVVETDSGYNTVFTSYPENYRDAERAIEVVRESLTGEGPLYNIFAETII